MPTPILMPALSPTMTEGTLAKWLKSEGDSVSSGDVIAEIETDKATMEVEAVDEGILAKIIVSDGSENVPVNQLIAVLAEEGEEVNDNDIASLSGDAPAAAESAKEEAPAATPAPAASAPAPMPTPAASNDTGGRVFASPLARRLAKENGVDLSTLKGSGPRGRIVKADVLAAGSAPTAATSSLASAPTVSSEARGADGLPAFDLVPASGMRKVIAKRLTESKQEVPHFYLTVEVELDNLLTTRKRINTSLEKQGVKISVNDFVIKSVAQALTSVPEANASWTDEGMKMYKSADISVAVAIDGGLITPIIKDAQLKTLSQISTEMKDLAARAREGKLMPEEFQGGTFSISNLGMFGIDEFSAIINPPQGGILAVGQGKPVPVIKGEEIAQATVMKCTLSVDHRVVDGAVGAQFVQAFKRYIEDPAMMLV